MPLDIKTWLSRMELAEMRTVLPWLQVADRGPIAMLLLSTMAHGADCVLFRVCDSQTARLFIFSFIHISVSVRTW